MKIELMHGFGHIDGYSRNSGCGYECGRRTFRWDNGPQGFGDGSPAGKSTQWPSTLNMAASFDPSLALEWGSAMGEEFYNKGTNIQEGPGINIARIPHNGRTFEYISGEDPVLGGALVKQVITGIQKNVMAIAKHYILNNQETHRTSDNAVVDEKTLMELYAPPFAAAAEADVAGYMCAYNLINGKYACENHETLRTMLKGYFNFSGFVVSDWGATHSTADAINAGLDIQMPDSSHFNQKNIQAALDAGTIKMSQIDESCLRILSGWYKLPTDKRYPCGGANCIQKNVSTAAHKALARKISAQSTVLLKNDGGLLPLDKTDASLRIAVIGNDAKSPYTAGGGSGHVSNSNAAVSPLDALTAAGVHIAYEPANGAPGTNAAKAAAAAKAADIAIVFASATSHEGSDRRNLLLNSQTDMEAIIAAVGSAQPKTVVVMAVPGQVRTDWRGNVSSILCAFLPGEQYGAAITDLIFGDAVPQARLPLSFPLGDNDQQMTKEQWPGVNSQSHYSEGQIVGYRWYDKHSTAPAFPFGHGLSYGKPFSYDKLQITGRTISFEVTPSAQGCDTPQVYFGYPKAKSDPSVPVKVLRYFEKVCASTASAPTSVSFDVDDRMVSTWNTTSKQWEVVKGTFDVWVLPSAMPNGNQGLHATFNSS